MAQLLARRHTQRLVLRPFEPGDLDDLASLYAQENVARYLYWEPRTRAESRVALERNLQRPRELTDDNVLPVAVVMRQSHHVIGDFILRWDRDEHRQGEIGGSLHPDYHGRNLAAEVYHELLEIGFTQ
jgi:RimJ/RimL family protein N-acetyltransferase